MKTKIWIVATASLFLAATAGAVPIYEESPPDPMPDLLNLEWQIEPGGAFGGSLPTLDIPTDPVGPSNSDGPTGPASLDEPGSRAVEVPEPATLTLLGLGLVGLGTLGRRRKAA